MKKTFKILKIDHIAIAVNNNNKSKEFFKLLGMDVYNSEHIENQKVNVIKVKTDNKNHTIELLEPSDSSSVVRKFINNRGQGLHHIALEVDDIKNAINYLKNEDVQFIYDSPQKGDDNKLITFIHPNSTPGILLELTQSIWDVS